MDAITAPETPFEVYVYLMAFRARTHLDEYLAFFNTFMAYSDPASLPATFRTRNTLPKEPCNQLSRSRYF